MIQPLTFDDRQWPAPSSVEAIAQVTGRAQAAAMVAYRLAEKLAEGASVLGRLHPGLDPALAHVVRLRLHAVADGQPARDDLLKQLTDSLVALFSLLGKAAQLGDKHQALIAEARNLTAREASKIVDLGSARRRRAADVRLCLDDVASACDAVEAGNASCAHELEAVTHLLKSVVAQLR